MSGKLNIIDQNTYQCMTKHNVDPTKRALRSAKYKNKHKNYQQCTLFDFLVVSRKKEKNLNKQKRPHFNIARNSVHLPIKRKGKTRLVPKLRVTRLKRIIKCHRKLKHQVAAESLHQSLQFIGHESCDISSNTSITGQLQNLSLGESGYPIRENIERNNVYTNLSPTVTETDKSMEAAPKIHSRRFRSYCDNCTTARLKELTTQLLKDLERFQSRAYGNNEIKARAHPRFVVGFREALSRLRINKVRLLLLAPDCEECTAQGGLDDTIDELKSVCQKQNVPYCFSLLRRELAYSLRKRAQISCVAILDYDGANETYRQLLLELDDARIQYRRLLSA